MTENKKDQSDIKNNPWFPKAEQGDAKAQYKLAMCIYKGECGEGYMKEAAKLFRKSAEQGEAFAQYMLGNCYLAGEGTRQDFKAAVNGIEKRRSKDHQKHNKHLEPAMNMEPGSKRTKSRHQSGISDRQKILVGMSRKTWRDFGRNKLYEEYEAPPLPEMLGQGCFEPWKHRCFFVIRAFSG